MATETASVEGTDDEDDLRGIKVTTVTALGGVFAGLMSSAVASGPGDGIALGVLAGAILLELGVIRVLGVEVEEFGLKDNLYVAFMTFSLWFVTWTILLTTGAGL